MSESQKKEIQDFIVRRFPLDNNWTNGNCLWFALILKMRFPKLNIYYLPVSGHFVAGALGTYFDWKEEVHPKEPIIPFDEIKENDELWYSHLVRDCFM